MTGVFVQQGLLKGNAGCLLIAFRFYINRQLVPIRRRG